MSAPQPLNDEMSDALNSNILSYLMQHLRSSFGISVTQVQHVIEVLAQKENSLSKDMVDHKAEIKKHQMEVSRHQAALISLDNQQKVLERCSYACRSLLSPIRRLPPEVLKEIFMHFCDESQMCYGGGVILPALKLAAVCSSWRNLAFSTPCLWTRIEVEMSYRSRDGARFSKRLVDLALENSKDLPLHVALDDFGHVQTEESASIVKSIARHSHRWRHATLGLLDDELEEMNTFVRDLPLLESLEVNACSPEFDMTNRVAPKLRDLALGFSPGQPGNLKLSWAQILTLKITPQGMPLSIILPYIERCTSLQRLHLDSYDLRSQNPGESHAIINIQSLFLWNLDIGALEQVFSRLTLPRLTKLSLSGTEEGCTSEFEDWIWTDEDGRIVESLLARSSCTITSLTLDRIPIFDNHLISLLRLLPSVEELRIVQLYEYRNDDLVHNITDLLVTSLHVSHSSSFSDAHSQLLLPKLREIELTMTRDCEPSCEALSEFVKSRWLPNPVHVSDFSVTCLKAVAFHFLSGIVDYDFASLMCLRDAGLKFTVTGMRELA